MVPILLYNEALPTEVRVAEPAVARRTEAQALPEAINHIEVLHREPVPTDHLEAVVEVAEAIEARVVRAGHRQGHRGLQVAEAAEEETKSRNHQ